ncbi:hypothetical protein FB107DRAFT_224614 [Schizophyllum commune]
MPYACRRLGIEMPWKSCGAQAFFSPQRSVFDAPCSLRPYSSRLQMIWSSSSLRARHPRRRKQLERTRRTSNVYRAHRSGELVVHIALRTRVSPSPHLLIHHVDRLWSPPRSLPQPPRPA